jgi:hypothetical protein
MATAASSPAGSVWLNRRGQLTDFFGSEMARQGIVNAWNAELTPQITTNLSTASAFVDYFEARAGLRAKLFALMRRHGFVPSFGLAGLRELEDEAVRLYGDGTMAISSFSL